jgi:hypothetical protein
MNPKCPICKTEMSNEFTEQEEKWECRNLPCEFRGVLDAGDFEEFDKVALAAWQSGYDAAREQAQDVLMDYPHALDDRLVACAIIRAMTPEKQP